MKTKALISFAVTAKLICVFVFTYADCWFSHDAAQIENMANDNKTFSLTFFFAEESLIFSQKGVGFHFQSLTIELYELRSEKTGLQDFRPSPTQTGLCSNRRWLEA